MAVEGLEEAGQGRVGGEMIAAGVAKEKRACVVILSRSTSFSVRAPMPGGSPRTVTTRRSPSIAASRPRSASVAAASLRQGVSRLSRMASVSATAQAAAIFASTSAAAPDAERPRSVTSRVKDAFGVGRRFEIDEEPPILAEALNDAWIVGRGQRERRLAHAEPARHDNWAVLFEDRRYELLEPILAADHFRVGRQAGWAGGGARRIRRTAGSGGDAGSDCGADPALRAAISSAISAISLAASAMC